jgi:hypothetical protein
MTMTMVIIQMPLLDMAVAIIIGRAFLLYRSKICSREGGRGRCGFPPWERKERQKKT